MTEIPDGTHPAVLDRFEDTQATRVAVLVVEGEDEEMTAATYKEAETTDGQEDAQARFDQPARRLPEDGK